MALENSFGDVSSRIKSISTYKRLIEDLNQLQSNASNPFQDSKQNLVTQLDQLKEAISGGTSNVKKFKKQIKSQFQELLDIAQQTQGSGLNTSNFLMKNTIKAWRKISPEIRKILVEEVIKAIGCSQEQTYISSPTPIYIKVSSVDLLDMLKESPTSEIGKVKYEKNAPNYGVRPFSLNRDMYRRVTNPNVSYFTDAGSNYYKGASGQNLFNYEYSQTGPFGSAGDYFKVYLHDRNTVIGSNPQIIGTNRIKDWIHDYYSTIRIADTTNIFSNLMNGLTGCIDIQGNVSSSKISADEKIALIIQRVLGLCFGNKQEIDVQGNAKVPEDEEIDDSFFELSEIDLRIIDEKINDRRNGVAEFQDCENLKLPIDFGSIYENLLNIEDINGANTPTIEQQDRSIAQLTSTLSNNPKWSILVPTNLNIQVKLNLNFITQLPKALIFSILSPKILFPLMVMLKSLGQPVVDLIDDTTSFMKNFRKFFINLVSKIGSLFVRELFELIKKDIAKLISSIKDQLMNNVITKKYAIILSLIELALLIARIINDWRKCKSIIDELIALLSLVGSTVASGFPAGGAINPTSSGGLVYGSQSGGDVPLPILFLTQFLPGYSFDRAFINTVQEMQKLGVPTGPMPDGSSNILLVAFYSLLKGQDTEENQNGKVEIAVPILSINPSGTIIAKAYGKKI